MTVYVYLLDTLADWEPGHVTAELKSGRFFRSDAPRVTVRTFGLTNEPITTMGGLRVTPDCAISDVAVRDTDALILPGANTWNDPKHAAVLDLAERFLAVGATVCAICGATAALAGRGLLDGRPHTSNGPGFLEMTAPAYRGSRYYVDEPSVADGNLITAAGTGGLMWAKQILKRLDVFGPDALEAWYQYYATGKAEHFYALMKALPSGGQN